MHILGKEIKPNTSHYLLMEVAKLHNRGTMSIPVIVERGKEDGPTVLLNAGVHGDELNGVEIVRQMIEKKLHKPNKGTIICIPTLNIFGFINQERKFPDGRDLNRVFPGSRSGSLAGQFAYNFRKEIAGKIDYMLDFHTGGAELNNIPQIRCVFNEKNLELAKVFGTYFIMDSKVISKSLRATTEKMGIPTLLFEGGKSLCFDDAAIEQGVHGAVRVLNHLGLTKNKVPEPYESQIIQNNKWLRAKHSGMMHLKVNFGDNGKLVEKDRVLATITGPYGNFSKEVKVPYDCRVFCVNMAPIVNKGDAIFHLTKISY